MFAVKSEHFDKFSAVYTQPRLETGEGRLKYLRLAGGGSGADVFWKVQTWSNKSEIILSYMLNYRCYGNQKCAACDILCFPKYWFVSGVFRQTIGN